MNKLGFYLENTTVPGLRQAIDDIKPPVLLIHAGDRGLLQDIRRSLAPDAFVIGRMYVEPGQQDAWLTSGDAAANGRAFADKILDFDFQMAREKGENGRLLFDAWMSLNECIPGPGSGDFQRGGEARAEFIRRYGAYDRFQVAFRERLMEHGIEAVAFNFGAGNFGTAAHYLDYFPETLRAYKYLGFHEYGWPAMSRDVDPAAESSAGTYRAVMAGIRERYGDQHRVVITEAGLARMYKNKDGGDVGWLYGLDSVSQDAYWRSLEWYNDHLLRDSYAVGACLYQVGHAGNWETFRHLGVDNQGRPLEIMARLRALRERPAPVTPPVTEPVTKPAKPPAPPVTRPEEKPTPTPAVTGDREGLRAIDRIGLDANKPLNSDGSLAPQVEDPTIIAATGVGMVRLNFVLGPWSSVTDQTLHDGRTWGEAYRAIIDGFRAKGLKIYGLIGAEAMSADPSDAFRDPPPQGAPTNPWLDRYVETFVAILKMFHRDLDAVESFNEPDDWHGARRSWVYPGWFAIMLQRLAVAVKNDPQIAQVKLISGPLQGLTINNNGAAGYLRQTYREGKKRFGWGTDAPFPFDGVGYHLYVEEDKNRPWPQQESNVRATYTSYLDGVKQVIREEEQKNGREGYKPLYVSEMGWYSNRGGEEFQRQNLPLGLSLLLADEWVNLAVWFCTQDFGEPEGDKFYGLYNLGPLAPYNRKPVYDAFQLFCQRLRTEGEPGEEGEGAFQPMPSGVTNQHMIDALYFASLELGLGDWELLERVGLDVVELAQDRPGRYAGPGVAAMSALTREQRRVVWRHLYKRLAKTAPACISFAPAAYGGWLALRPDLAVVPLSPPRTQRLRPAYARNRMEQRVVRVWNRYGFLLMEIGARLGIELPSMVALLAVAGDGPGVTGDGRLVIRFENQTFHDLWGVDHEARYARHFSADAARPWQQHRWRSSAHSQWRPVHVSQRSEWAAFTLARSLDDEAACLATAMGFAGIMGFNHALLGYESARRMFEAFSTGERRQILGYFDFMAGLDGETRRLRALRDGNLNDFAALHWGIRDAARQVHAFTLAIHAFERLRRVD